tara:strand:- start:358 stop:1122 length:765 start_codon:yes stop_codon:yes gene_type:complete
VSHASTARGFSLLETLIALGLIGVLIATIGLFVNQIAGSRTQLRTMTGRDAVATAVFDGLETALMTSIARTGDGSPGITGTSRTVSIAHDGVVVSRIFGDMPQAVLEPESTIRFEFDDATGGTRLRRDASSSSMSETPLGAVRFRYLSNGEWSSSWDSFESGGLPAAIECSIWWVSPFEDERSPDEFESDDLEPDLIGEGAGVITDDLESPPPDRVRLMRVPGGGVSDGEDQDESMNVDDVSSSEDDLLQGGDS